MKILVVGNGGREHALAWRLAQDADAHTLFCAPGNAGTARHATNVPIAADDVAGLLAWARKNRPDLTVVGPEVPLCAGLVDALETEGLRAFGPSRAAARLEGSKLFAKEVMAAAGVPTAHAASYTNVPDALRGLEAFALPVVIKADGLAAGKGVSICTTREEAATVLTSMLVDGIFGAAGAKVLIEEFLEGEEASILALVDGERIVMLPASQDHKRVFDHDEGPNTGGMGAYAPAPVVTPELIPVIRTRVLEPTVAELRRRGIVFKGVLYAGLMLTRNGPKVLEFNCRFGDPETQVILPLLAGDFATLLGACADGRLDASMLKVRPEACATVVMASGGYPGAYRKGQRIRGLEAATQLPNVQVFHAGTTTAEGHVVTAGGRVLTVTAWGVDLRAAVAQAYQAVDCIAFEGAHYRRDIAHRAL